MSMCLQASSGAPPPQSVEREIVRRTANYHPSIWEDHFLPFDNPNHVRTDGVTEEKVKQLKEEVKKMLVTAADKPQQQMKLIDDIQRLGVAYHFQAEINAAFKRMHDIYRELCDDDDDLNNVALCFRLLRQHGHKVSSDVFNKFKDLDGKFKECLTKDVQGLLSLYEATHLRVHGEDILEEALAFTTFHLEQLKSSLTKPLSDHVIFALQIPLWRSTNRVEARRYISFYSEADSHNKALLSFAILDFSILQKLYQKELGSLERWWKKLNIKEKLPYARDRLVESYIWVLGMHHEPQYVLARRITTKLLAYVVVVADDTYDLYGTHEELLVLTDAIERWDICATDELPAEYLKIFYRMLLDVYNEIEEEMAEARIPLYRLQYSKDALKQVTRTYIQESKWLSKGYVPTYDEYLPNAVVSTTVIYDGAAFFVGMKGDLVTKEALEWMSTSPPVVWNAAAVCRIIDDIIEYKNGEDFGDVATAVECYIKQHGVSKEVANAELKKQLEDGWKTINEECLHPTAIPFPLAIICANMAKTTLVLYQDNHAFRKSETRTKQLITSLLVDPVVPI